MTLQSRIGARQESQKAKGHHLIVEYPVLTGENEVRWIVAGDQLVLEGCPTTLKHYFPSRSLVWLNPSAK